MAWSNWAREEVRAEEVKPLILRALTLSRAVDGLQGSSSETEYRCALELAKANKALKEEIAQEEQRFQPQREDKNQ